MSNFMQSFWSRLTGRAKAGLVSGAILALVLTISLGYWAMKETYLLVAGDMTPERLATATQALDAAKVRYQISPDGTTLAAIEADASRARIALSGAGGGSAPNLGLELFNSTDFAATEFTQRVNFQRALQGELTRTIQGLDGIRAARVHIVLPESVTFRKRSSRPSAAVALSLAPGYTLNPAQVRGIQRLVSASVPDIKLEEVTLVDFSGRALTHVGTTEEGEASTAQLDLKRSVDAYFEAKLQRLLSDTLPIQGFSVAVDATLNFDQLKITTDQPLAAKAPLDGDRDVGVAIREKQTLRSNGGRTTDGQDVAEVTDSEYEYRVGHRLEESLQSPGGIKRLSVAVVVHGEANQTPVAELERLISHAIGTEIRRGDQVAVLVVPAGVTSLSDGPQSPTAAATSSPPEKQLEAPRVKIESISFIGAAALALVICAGIGVFIFSTLSSRRIRRTSTTEADIDTLTERVRVWLKEDVQHVPR